MRAVFLAFTIVLAGCVSPSAVERDQGPSLPAGPNRLVYGVCEELLGAFPVEPGAVPLPEGFAAAPFLVDAAAAVFVVGWSCELARDDSGLETAEPFVEAFAGFGVTPPDEWALEGAFAHAILLGLATGSPVAQAAYESWGIPATAESPSFGWTNVGSVNQVTAGGMGSLAGTLGSLDIDMRVTTSPEASDPASAVRFFVVESGSVAAAYDIAWVDASGKQGQAVSSAALPGAPPATSGLGSYYASDDPDRYVMTPFDLGASGASSEP